MPRHRGRGRARWSLLALGLVSLLVLGWTGWGWLQQQVSRRPGRGADCVRGEAAFKVAVAPSAEQPVREAAKRWNANRTAVSGHCVRVAVSSVDSAAALAGLTGEWNARELGDRPHAWLPESSLWTDRLAATDDALLATAPESIARSPVVLAAPREAAGVLAGKAEFEWADLADLSVDTSGWARFGKPDWGRITIALPAPAANPASGLAIQAMLASVAKESPITPQVLTQVPVTTALTALARAQPADVPDTARAALVKLAEAPDMRSAPYSAVPVLEVDLHRRNLATDGRPAARLPLFEVVANGPSPAADFPFVVLGGGEPDLVRDAAADRFRAFLAEPAQQREFGRAGLRGRDGDERPPNSLGMSWGDASLGFAPADPATAQRIAGAWATAVDGGGIVTVLVDVSRTMGNDGPDGRSRLDWVKDAVRGYADYTVSGSVGLWRFGRALDRGEPYQELVPTGPVANNRGELRGAVDRLVPGGATELHESVAAGYRSAVEGYVAGRRNQLVVITDGGADGAMTLAQLKTALRATGSKDRPVSVSVIAIGSEVDEVGLRELAMTTGGTVSLLADAAGVPAALGQAVAGAG